MNEAKKNTFDPEEEVVKKIVMPPPSYNSEINQTNEFDQPKEQAYNSIIVRGLPESLLDDEDTLFDIENLAFTDFSLDTLKPTDGGILVTFENPLTVSKKDEVQEKFLEVLKSLTL